MSCFVSYWKWIQFIEKMKAFSRKMHFSLFFYYFFLLKSLQKHLLLFNKITFEWTKFNNNSISALLESTETVFSYALSNYFYKARYAIQKWPFFWNLSSNYQSSLVFLCANSLYASLFLESLSLAYNEVQLYFQARFRPIRYLLMRCL